MFQLPRRYNELTSDFYETVLYTVISISLNEEPCITYKHDVVFVSRTRSRVILEAFSYVILMAVTIYKSYLCAISKHANVYQVEPTTLM